MSAEPQTVLKEIVYPDSDGKPMADNTKQFRWIVTIQGGLDAQYRDDPEVFVAGDLLWYPIEGQPSIRVAPDVMVAFGRPKGDRGSYQQWREGGIAPQVVFEVLSPGNTLVEMIAQLRFYERYGVEEFYIYDPDHGALSGWIGGSGELSAIESMNGWVSPLLGIRFTLEQGGLVLYHPDGRSFASYVELARLREQAQQTAEQEIQRAEQAQQAAEQERQRAEQAQQTAEQEIQRAERLAERLRALGINPGEGEEQ